MKNTDLLTQSIRERADHLDACARSYAAIGQGTRQTAYLAQAAVLRQTADEIDAATHHEADQASALSDDVRSVMIADVEGHVRASVHNGDELRRETDRFDIEHRALGLSRAFWCEGPITIPPRTFPLAPDEIDIRHMLITTVEGLHYPSIHNTLGDLMAQIDAGGSSQYERRAHDEVSFTQHLVIIPRR